MQNQGPGLGQKIVENLMKLSKRGCSMECFTFIHRKKKKKKKKKKRMFYS